VSVHRRWPVLLPLLCLAACAGRPDDPPPPADSSHAALAFDPAACGSVAGVVRWQGDVPRVEPFRSIDEPLSDQPDPPPARDRVNPNVPRIDPQSRALAGAIVYLRGVDATKARPWHHPPLRVDMRDQAFVVRQGAAGNVGFAKLGDSVEFVSHDERFHVAQARGAAFFALTLPRPGLTRSRRLDSPGVVELASGSGYFWMRAYVHVSDHPYFTRTDSQGRFRLDQVPAGDYEIVAWHPDWRVRGEYRNPDLFRVQQVRFRPPLQSTARVGVRANETADAELSLSARRQ
jgi:hypothetical protein